MRYHRTIDEMRRSILIFIISLGAIYSLAVGQLSAQQYLYDFGGGIGIGAYQGDLSRRGLIAKQDVAATLLTRYNINFRCSLLGEVAYQRIGSKMKFADNIFPAGMTDLSFSSHLANMNFGLEFNFLPWSNKFRYLNTSSFTPYILLGGGMTVAVKGKACAYAPNTLLGLGVKYRFTDRLSVAMSCQYQYSLTDKLDALDKGSERLNNPYQLKADWLKNKDAYYRVCLTIAYAFGEHCEYSCAEIPRGASRTGSVWISN